MAARNNANVNEISHILDKQPVNTPEKPKSAGHIADEDDEKVVAVLRETYGARFYQRERYLHLVGFLAFIALYFAILLLQSNPGLEYRAREGMYEAIVPKDENGDPLEFFLDDHDIYVWLSEVVEATWLDTLCGDAWCESPFEYPSFSTHGCQADCGSANGTNFTVVLEPRFLQQFESESLEAVTYNLCTQDVEPLCWWEISKHFHTNFKRVEYKNLSLPDGVWQLQVYNLAPDHGLVMGGIAESAGPATTTTVTARRSRRRRALYEEADGGWPRSPGPHRFQRQPRSILNLRQRTLTSDSATDSDVYDGHDSDSDSNNNSDYDNSSNYDVMPSEWTRWSQTLLASMQDVNIGSLEKCAMALEDLKVLLLEYDMDCGIKRDSRGLSSLCCPAYKTLLEENCWCTAVAFDDYSLEIGAHVMHDAYFNATACHTFEPETYPPLVRGRACPINPELSKIWDISDDVNTAACYWEFRNLFGDFSSSYLSETEFTLNCVNESSYRSFAANDPSCCELIQPAIEVYNCSCMSCTEQNSIEARLYMQLLVDLAMDCNLTLPGVHQDCDIQDAPRCAVNINNAYLTHNLSASARLSAQWNTWQKGHVLDQYEPLSYVYGEAVDEVLEKEPVVTYATFATCEESEVHAPFVCESYLDYLCIFFINAMHSDDFCRDPQLTYLACDTELLTLCAEHSMNFCNGDDLCSTETCLYSEFIDALTATLSTECHQGQPACADVDANCSQRLPAIRSRLEECATEEGSWCAQGGNVAEYFPTSMALCARFNDWSTEDVGEDTYADCARILYAVRSLDHRFNFAVGAQDASDVGFCNLTSQHSNCAATDGSLEFTFSAAMLGDFPATNLSSGCRIHDDCPYGYFCALAVTSGATNSLCMPCWWCEGCDDSGASPPWLLYPAAPTCGHCPCATQCAPGCTNAMLNNGICDRECFNEECQYDSMTCTSHSIDSSERLDCPEGARQLLQGANPGLERFYPNTKVQMCCPTVDHKFGVLSMVAEVNVSSYPRELKWSRGWRNNHNQTSFDMYQFITTKNRIIGGIVMQVQRADFNDCPAEEFHHLLGLCLPTDVTSSNALDGGYGTDGVFQIGNEFYDAQVAQDQSYHYPDPSDLNDFGVPYLMKALDMGGEYKTYPAVIDINLSQERAQEMLRYLEASTFIDARTVKISIQLLTFNGVTPYFTSCHFDITSSTDGSWRIFTEIRSLDTVWFDGWLDVLRVILELVLVIIFFKGLFSEVEDMFETKRQTGSMASHFKDIFNVLDGFAMAFMLMAMLTYIAMMVQMKEFTVDVRYNIYESLSGVNSTGGHVNWLKLLNDGKGMTTFGQKLEDFNHLLSLKAMYHFFTGFAILINLLRVLKLMDFHPDIGMVTRTMREAGTDLINFVGLLLTIVTIYGFMGYIVFGNVSGTFHRLDYSMLSCFVMMMGETAFSEDIPKLGGLVDQIVGLTFFYSFMVLVFLFLLSGAPHVVGPPRSCLFTAGGPP